MTAEILSKIAAAAKADAVVFVDEFTWGELSAIDGAFEIYRKHLVAEIDRLSGRLSE